MDDLIVIDDFIPRQLQDRIEGLLLSGEMTWRHSTQTTYDPEDDPLYNYMQNYSGIWDSVQDEGQLSRSIYNSKGGEQAFMQEYFGLFETLIWFMFDRVEDSYVRNLQRIKVNLNTRRGQEFVGKITVPHIDYPFENSKTILYYANDSDGDTILYNERYRDTLGRLPLTERARISPKKGRAIIFDSDIVHAREYNTVSLERAIVNIILDTTPPGEEPIQDKI